MRKLRQFREHDVIFFLTVIIVAILVVYPLVWLLRGSFIESFDKPEFTLKWYIEAFTIKTLVEALKNTLIYATGSTFIALLFGVPVAWFISRTNMPLAKQLEVVALIPFVNIPYIGAIAWILLASPKIGFINKVFRLLFGLQIDRGPLNIYSNAGMIWVMGLYSAAYVFLFTSAALKRMDPAYEEVARVSGSGLLKTTLTITLPLIAPAISSAALLAFVVAFGNFGIPAVLGVPNGINVLATEMYRVSHYFPPHMEQASALGSILMIVSLAGIWLHGFILRGKEYAIISGKGYKPTRIDLGPWRWIALATCLGFLFISVVLPILALGYGAVVKYWTTSINLELFTLNNFRYILLEYGRTWIAIRNSFFLAFITATSVTLITVIAAYIVERTRWRLRFLMNYLTILPLGVPGAVLAVGILIAYIRPPLVLYGTIWILAVAYITHFIPFGMRSASSSLAQVQRELEEGSIIAGSKWLRTFRKITLPLAAPGLLAGWTMLFIICMRELSTSVFLYSPGSEVIGVAIFELYDVGNNTRVAAFSLILVLFSLTAVALVRRLVDTDIVRGVTT